MLVTPDLKLEKVYFGEHGGTMKIFPILQLSPVFMKIMLDSSAPP